jgi:hypothetical protein
MTFPIMGFVGLQLYGIRYGNNRYTIRYDHIMKCPNLGVIKRHKSGRTRPLVSYKFLIWKIFESFKFWAVVPIGQVILTLSTYTKQ